LQGTITLTNYRRVVTPPGAAGGAVCDGKTGALAGACTGTVIGTPTGVVIIPGTAPGMTACGVAAAVC
jgi:hypothetical protein